MLEQQGSGNLSIIHPNPYSNAHTITVANLVSLLEQLFLASSLLQPPPEVGSVCHSQFLDMQVHHSLPLTLNMTGCFTSRAYLCAESLRLHKALPGQAAQIMQWYIHLKPVFFSREGGKLSLNAEVITQVNYGLVLCKSS